MIAAELNKVGAKVKFQQTGYFEKYILCSKCDNELIGKWERYTALVLYGGRTISPPTFQSAISPDGIKSIFIDNIDYIRLKLCILSILWRAHISENKFFKKVNIEDYEERIREMLLHNDAKDELNFKIAIVGVRNQDGLLRMVIDPTVARIEEGEIGIFFINGLFYFIELKLGSGFSLFKKHFLNESGRYELMILDGKQGKTFMSSFGLPMDFVKYYFPE